MTSPVFQDHYPEAFAHCYGCGRLNAPGLHLQTVWEGEDSVTRYRPRPEHMAVPGYVYGGLVASLIDCHGTGTASAAMARHEGRELGTEPVHRFVTASLQVDFLAPTPLEADLEVRGRVIEIKGRRVTVEATLWARGVITARGVVVAVQMPPSFG